MTDMDLSELVAVLGAAGTILEPLVESLLAQPAPLTTEDGIDQIVSLMIELYRRLGIERTRRLRALLQTVSQAPETLRKEFEAALGALSPHDAGAVIGVIELLDRWISWRRDPELRVHVDAALARHVGTGESS